MYANKQETRRKYDKLSQEEKLDIIITTLDEILAAFPDGPEKHREAHESWIAAKKAETEFWKDLKLEIAKKGIWGLIVLITGLILIGLSVKLGYPTGY